MTARLRFLAVAASALGLGAVAIAISPASHDYGKVAVNGLKSQDFSVTLPRSSTPRGTLLKFRVTGADSVDFMISGVSATMDPFSWTCDSLPAQLRCEVPIDFRPKSVGVKVAVFQVTDNHGGLATAALTGEGVQPLCRPVVVPCNFSHFYTGTFIWTSTLQGPQSSYTEHVTVTVMDGVASCNGSATDVDHGQSQIGSMTGDGLIGVEFLRDDTYRLKYKITVACPTPGFPGAPSRPAELGHYEQTSDEQEASGYRIDLKGAIGGPSPDTDKLNGVTGAINIRWDLKSSAPPKAP